MGAPRRRFLSGKLKQTMHAEKRSRSLVVLMMIAWFTGSVSLLLFGFFLWHGAWQSVALPLSATGQLLWNAGLSVLFFLQHSGMVRRSLWLRLAPWLPKYTHRAVYTITSGVVLTAVVFLWQPADTVVLELQGGWRWLARGVFFTGLAGFAWSSIALQYFDAFGISDLRAHLQRTVRKSGPFSIRGPYRWVRHPFYLFTIFLIWSCPDLTIDRLLFNVIWTAWIYIGARLEERDLVAEFQEQYRHYQRCVPMLIPWKGPLQVKAGKAASTNR